MRRRGILLALIRQRCHTVSGGAARHGPALAQAAEGVIDYNSRKESFGNVVVGWHSALLHDGRQLMHSRRNIRSGATHHAQNRAFGFLASAALAIAGAWPVLGGASPHLWLFWSALGLAALALIRPGVLRPFTRLWLGLGHVLHRITNPVILGLIFCVAMVPIGLLWRLIGKDPLRLRRDPHAASYWLERVPPGPSPESQKKQF